MTLFYGIMAYIATGLLVAIGFVSFGIGTTLEPPRQVSLGARLLALPGAVLLWPYVLIRWVDARGRT
jgi:hypothetical protein